MKVVKAYEAGFESALYGFALSYKPSDIPSTEWWTKERFEQTKKTALANAHRDGGHNKFLEHMGVCVYITANLEWWKQFDTYRIGVSKQSSSTMHTLDKGSIVPNHLDLRPEDFKSINDWHVYIDYLNMISVQSPRTKSKALPQAYLQEREVIFSYKVIRHIIKQRYNHKLPEWESFIRQLVECLDRPEYLGKDIMQQIDYEKEHKKKTPLDEMEKRGLI